MLLLSYRFTSTPRNILEYPAVIEINRVTMVGCCDIVMDLLVTLHVGNLLISWLVS
jgi:hypothetical protein